MSLLVAALITFFALIKLSLPAAFAENETSTLSAQATTYNRADGALAEAEALRVKWEEGALRQSIPKYEEAASLWQSVSPDKSAEALRRAGDVYFILSDYKQTLQYYERALAIIERTGDRVAELRLLNSIGYVYIYLSENQKALSYARKVRKGCGRLPPSVGKATKDSLEAQSLNNIGEIYYALGDLKGSLKMFEQALDLWTSANDRRGIALAHLNLGYSHADIGNLAEASEQFHRSLALWQEIGDRHGEALASTAFGAVYSFLGDKQSALNLHMGAITLFRQIGNHQGEAAAINGVAQAYEDLNEYQKALESYQQALGLYQMVGHRDFVALNKYYIGRVYFALKDVTNAQVYYLEALKLSRAVGDKQIEAHVLKGLGIIDDAQGNPAGALKRFQEVLSLYNRIGDRKGEAYTLNSIGHVYYTARGRQQALTYFRRALSLIQSTEDTRGGALTLYNIARVERDYGNLEDALAHIKESIAIIEASRAKVDSRDLRTSYFTRAHKHYELYIDLLMQLYRQHPDSNYGVEAFMASERARARSLLDILTEERFDFGTASDDRLLLRERELAQFLNAKRDYRTRLLSGKQASDDARQVSEEIHTLMREYEEVRARIREQNPRYAAITQPSQLSIGEIQAELADGDTLLLEFWLGDEKSYLWVVGPNSVNGYELPRRAVIESIADRVYELLVARQLIPDDNGYPGAESIAASDADYLKEAAKLSHLLLGPAAAQLESKRLLIVTDGKLHYIPFEALPALKQPGEQLTPDRLLIDEHEIVELPSASILAVIRRDMARPTPDAKLVKILADPVFDRDDPRVLHPQMLAQDSPAAGRVEDIYLQRALRSLNGDSASSSIPRLPASLKEAKAIMAVTPQGEGAIAIGFDASRARIMSDNLKNYRIIHFATHGILDNEHPEMSGLILSLIDKEGNSQDGYLRLHDIYSLNMSADLVVLSACRTGLGREVQGEGLIGLTRGFMYAGSKGVVASLWKVDDEATAELMKNFYTFMLRDGLPPAAALRAAKQTLRSKSRWRSPYFWAGFVLQGEYNKRFVLTKEGAHLPQAAPFLAAMLGAAALFLWWRKRKKAQTTSVSTRL